MITIQNYKSITKDIDFSKLPESMQEANKNFDDFVQYYDKDKDIKSMMDVYIQKLNVAAAKQLDKKKPEKQAETKKEVKSKPNNVVKKKKASPKSTSKEKKVTSKEKPLYRSGKRFYFNHDEYIIIKKAHSQQNGSFNYDIDTTKTDYGKAIDQERIKKMIDTGELKAKRPALDAKAEKVERVPLEVSFIKRYILLHGKQKNKMQILSFLASLQKAMIEKRIRKTSRYAKEILYLQDKLIELVGMFNSSTQILEISIKAEKLTELQEIAYSQVQMPDVRFIKRIISMQGKKVEKEKVEKIILQLKKAVKSNVLKKDDKYASLLEELFTQLQNYTTGKSTTVSVHEQTLNGLMGLHKKPTPQELKYFKQNRAAILKIIDDDLFMTVREAIKEHKESKTKKKNTVSFKKGQVISSSDLAGVHFELMGFKDKWLKIIGDPEIPFKCMVFGRAGMGKTSFAIMLAEYLSNTQNKKVLFVADEEGLSYKLQEKLKRFKAFHPNLDVVDSLPADISKYNFVIIDSATSMRMKPEEFEQLTKKYNKTSFIIVLQAIKTGDFKGENEWEHAVDVKIRFEDGIATTLKSRFGGSGEMKVY